MINTVAVRYHSITRQDEPSMDLAWVCLECEILSASSNSYPAVPPGEPIHWDAAPWLLPLSLGGQAVAAFKEVYSVVPIAGITVPDDASPPNPAMGVVISYTRVDGLHGTLRFWVSEPELPTGLPELQAGHYHDTLLGGMRFQLLVCGRPTTDAS